MDELLKLEHLSLVSKICTELDNNLGINDKDLAEFIIDLAEKNPQFEGFKKALIENGAEFPDSFISNLLRIIQLMKTSKTSANADTEPQKDANKDLLATKFPGLAMPNRFQDETLEDEKKDLKNVKDVKYLKSVADDMMDELEALAPKGSNENEQVELVKEKKREHSRDRKRRSASREHKADKIRKRSRSRSRDRRRRSRSRDKRRHSRDRSRSRNRERKRSRERNRDKKRSPDRRARSR